MAAITSATSGLSNATSTWTGGVAPVVGDKVTIQRPGTVDATPYVLNGAHAAGATSIAVTGGSGTIVAGECIQIDHQIGSDVDGAIYDNTYYKVTTGITGPGTLVIAAPGLSYSMASGTPVHDCGHVVELAANHVWGDDTSSTASDASNGISLQGTIKFPRNASRTLTMRGTLAIGSNATLDVSAKGDVIQAGVSHVIECNDSATLANVKHGIVVRAGAANTRLKIWGPDKTRNTTLTASIAANATSVTVDASTEWAIGDRIVLASPTNDPTLAQAVALSGGSHPTWTVSAPITTARPAGTDVGNLTSRITIKPKDTGFAGFMSIFQSGTPTRARWELGNFTLQNMGSGAGWVTGGAAATYTSALMLSGQSLPRQAVRRVAYDGIGSGAMGGPAIGNANFFGIEHLDFAVYAPGGSIGQCCYAHSAGVGVFDGIVYNASIAAASSNSEGAGDIIARGKYWGRAIAYNGSAAIKWKFDAAKLKATTQIFSNNSATVECDSCEIDSPTRLFNYASTAGSSKVTLRNCTFLGATLTGAPSGSVPSQSAKTTIINTNGDTADHRVRSYYQETITDATTRKRSTYAVKIQPKVANTAITYTFTVPAVAGVQQTIKGSLRFDSTYGTATPPRIDLSGQGVTQSKVCAAVADTWDDFTFTFTPASTGDITATVTVQSASTTGAAWLDGVYHYPMTQSVRHFGYLWQPQAAQVVDPSITVSEATALAYPVTVNHGTGTITVSGNATARQVYEACMADLVQTANQGVAKHISTADNGASFSTSYNIAINTGCTVTGNFATTGTVALAGTATVAGVYTSAAGQSTYLTLTGVVGATVAVYDGSGAQYALATPVTGTFALSIPPGQAGTWAWKTARYGYMAQGATFMPNTGAVTASPTQLPDSGITQATAATVVAYASLDSPDRIYDYLAYWETTAAGIATARLATKAGAACDLGTKKLVLDAGAASVLAWNSGTSTLTLKAGTMVAGTSMSELIATGDALGLVGGASIGTLIYTDSAGRHVLVSAPNLIANTRVQLYDVAGAAEIVNTKLTGSGFSYRMVWTADKTIRYRAGYCEGLAAKSPIEGTAVLTSAGLQILDAQVDDAVYVANGIDGLYCDSAAGGEFTADYPNLQIDVDDPDGLTSVQRIYAWSVMANSSSAGIAQMFKAVRALDAANYVIDTTVVNARLDNRSASPLKVVGGYLVRSDGSTVIAAGSGSIQMDPGRAYLARDTASRLVLAADDRLVVMNNGNFLAKA